MAARVRRQPHDKRSEAGCVAIDYSSVTELPGSMVTRDQLARVCHRYYFAGGFCDGKDVLEVACGPGLGLGYLATRAKRVVGGDITKSLVDSARRHYGSRVELLCLDAHTLPFPERSFDVVILYEAIYYLSSPDRFLSECRRVLRPNGVVLICTVNKEWNGFNPSPYSVRYFSVPELHQLLEGHGFQAEVFGAFPDEAQTARDKVVSFIRRVAVRTGLIPKTMEGKRYLKRLFYGRLTPLPPEIRDGMVEYHHPVRLPPDSATSAFKVIYFAARLPAG